MEEWLPIEDFPGYEVSSLGRVRNVHTERLLGVHDNGRGVLQVVLRRDNRNHARAVHRLVANAFLDLPPDGYVPIFLDEDRKNLAASNLEWRPRWQAQKRTRQSQRTEPTDPRPIRMDRTGVVYSNALECAKAIDGLEEQILLAAQYGYGSKYKGSTFSFVYTTNIT